MSKENKIGIRDFGTYENNPFEVKGIKMVSGKAKGRLMVDSDTGEYLDVIPAIINDIPKDTKEYRKIFIESINSIKEFSIPSLKIWTFILMNLKIRDDEVVCELEAIKNFTGYKSNVDVYKGLTELLDKKFIARKRGYKSVYFINSNMMFNGKRI